MKKSRTEDHASKELAVVKMDPHKLLNLATFLDDLDPQAASEARELARQLRKKAH